MSKLGLGESAGPPISVLDLSMLSSEVLPYTPCSIVGRLLLEAREHLPASRRYRNPWGLGARGGAQLRAPPPAPTRTAGIGSRVSPMNASPRKGGSSDSHYSLLANDRAKLALQSSANAPTSSVIDCRIRADIDYFLRIIPVQARRLLDQVTVLASGEAIAFGSAFHVPSRVQIDMPKPTPYSQTAAPFLDWSRGREPFPIDDVLTAWGLLATSGPQSQETGVPASRASFPPESSSGHEPDDDIPF